ncbi:hypothetical protein J2W88_003949 [Acidovorax delafieldii]|uniref:Uncharacterized protein n=1 Tax=Acidovorax delafieldii TaxID=47920 RepID=A0AAJ2F2E2_ACIDE|nr:hypothetical protein [Acidovorax delafieldii]MDR6768645.1 hypothetical protein [Acidovorax delafieldii]MDR6837360.1 hypothetical protein [Acidovorax delafieldii]MDR7366851.1 hypothetical protein [Acidovorax delafieldii]
MNSKQVAEEKAPRPEGLSKSHCEMALEGLGCHGLGRLGGLGWTGSCSLKIKANKLFALRYTQEHHSGMWNAVTLPIADARHGETEHA